MFGEFDYGEVFGSMFWGCHFTGVEAHLESRRALIKKGNYFMMIEKNSLTRLTERIANDPSKVAELQAAEKEFGYYRETWTKNMERLKKEVSAMEEFLGSEKYERLGDIFYAYHDEKEEALKKAPSADAVPVFGRIASGYTVYYLGPAGKLIYDDVRKCLSMYVLCESEEFPGYWWIWGENNSYTLAKRDELEIVEAASGAGQAVEAASGAGQAVVVAVHEMIEADPDDEDDVMEVVVVEDDPEVVEITDDSQPRHEVMETQDDHDSDVEVIHP